VGVPAWETAEHFLVWGIALPGALEKVLVVCVDDDLFDLFGVIERVNYDVHVL
jgi:hypothetical protein